MSKENSDFKLSHFARKIPSAQPKSNRGEALAGKERVYEIDPEKAQELSERLGSEVSVADGHTHVMKLGSKKAGNLEYILGSKEELEEMRALEKRSAARRIKHRSVHEPLRGETVFITGGNAGIGKAAAKHLHQKGAMVHISGRNQETLNSTVQEIGDEGIHAVQADVSIAEQCKTQFSRFEKTGEKIDVLFVNAGIFDITPVTDITEEGYDEMMNINVKGALLTMQNALKHLNDGAVIIVNTSIAADRPDSNNAVYAATKASLERLAIGFANSPTLRERGIRSVALSPGLTDTKIFENALGSVIAATEFKDKTISSIPAGRAGTPNEMADAIEWIIKNKYFNAEVLEVNGGLRRAGGSLVPEMSGSSR